MVNLSAVGKLTLRLLRSSSLVPYILLTLLAEFDLLSSRPVLVRVAVRSVPSKAIADARTTNDDVRLTLDGLGWIVNLVEMRVAFTSLITVPRI